MGWLNRLRGGRSSSGGAVRHRVVNGVDTTAVRAHCERFVATRRGVEAYVEPATNVTASTIVLIAHDGEWTRRAVPSRQAGFQLGQLLGIPVYDVNQTGYPGRMREWNSRQRHQDRTDGTAG
ncbi:MAG TPA: hypothetical protein VFL99_08590 [Segeticoccus sp.]|uniref:hypothetical protein n=1 Tax=Segeticoccus sp. TaxID=2706531 RepID=UPI002D7F621E|nr:hypothetical protein [Segeticoccus sp.]HET8600370.1 hypothetical protein [Segeticoccus sp.]